MTLQMRGAMCFENWAWEDTPLPIIFETGFLEELRGTRENLLIKSDLFLTCYGLRWPFQGEEERSWWRRKAYFSQPSQAPRIRKTWEIHTRLTEEQSTLLQLSAMIFSYSLFKK